MAVKDILKDKPKKQRYVAVNNVDSFKKQGWKEIEIKDMKMKKIIDRNKDLILMEK